MTNSSFTKLALGGAIAVAFLTHYVLLESSCANASDLGAGELVITLGGSAKGAQAGTRFPAPLYVNAGAKLPVNGTADAELLWIENLCDDVLDCSSCPLVIEPRFNVSELVGKVLLYDNAADPLLYTCGLNRIGRALGTTGIVGLGYATVTNAGTLDVAGISQKRYRSGECRDAKPRNGDAGIPFPHFSAYSLEVSLFIVDTIINRRESIRAVITPTAPNPWRATLCGYWKPLGTLLMLGHAFVIEQAICNLIGHVSTSGGVLRADLAQMALSTEVVAHLLMALLHHDPQLQFHWAILPAGLSVFLAAGSALFTSSSTLLLAAFWCVCFSWFVVS